MQRAGLSAKACARVRVKLHGWMQWTEAWAGVRVPVDHCCEEAWPSAASAGDKRLPDAGRQRATVTVTVRQQKH
jgi:hypothetical protein